MGVLSGREVALCVKCGHFNPFDTLYYNCSSADRDLPPTTSSEATTANGAATCTAVLVIIMLATPELTDEP